jgi:cystathionine beta-lyase/cystathionine gamma-synthase
LPEQPKTDRNAPDYRNSAIETKVVHAGVPRPRIAGSVAIPIFQSTVFEYKPLGSYHDIEYPRFNSLPNQLALGEKIASLENAEDAVPTASGMAAITTALLTVLGKGSHLLIQECVYGGTHNFLTDDIGDFGIAFDFIDAHQPETWKGKLLPNTRAIYVEAITNPLVQVADHEAVVKFAKEHQLISLIDNTFATPVNFRPISVGYDVVLHSATKYLNGHSDLVAGAIVGPTDLITKIRHRLNHLGGCLDPHACFLLDRGLKTLVLRVRQQNANAQALATFLETHPKIKKVNYPGLKSHPDHHHARRLFEGFGGMLSFELSGGAPASEYFVNNVTLPIHAASLGGVETLVTRPALTSHSGISAKERENLGIGDGLIRCSVGIEAVDELIDDFSRTLKALPQ